MLSVARLTLSRNAKPFQSSVIVLSKELNAQIMDKIYEESISCPYCGENLEVLINTEDASQEYIEDCQVCCHPITFVISTAMNGELQTAVHSEDETY